MSETKLREKLELTLDGDVARAMSGYCGSQQRFDITHGVSNHVSQA
jgi:hypothetical protein